MSEQQGQGYWDRIKPWDCPACEMKRISANKTTCPRCHEPRYDSTALPGSKVQSLRERIAPWNCAVCGQVIAASKTECPKCRAAKPGSAQAQTEAVTGQTTREYEGEKALREGIAAMAAQGWKVVSQTSYQPRAGLGRIAVLGLGAAVIKPQVKFVVTYERMSGATGGS